MLHRNYLGVLQRLAEKLSEVIDCGKECETSKKKESQANESIFGGFARESAARSRSGSCTSGDREAVRGLASHHQALSETAARNRKRGSQTQTRTAAQEVGTAASRASRAVASAR